jgi:hypothetical protein
MLYRGDLRLLLSLPGEPHALPDGTLPEPGGWNRIILQVSDLEGTVEALHPAGVQFRNDIGTGIGSKQILVQDPARNLVELFQPIRSEARLSS